jgi:hypothetical protein
MMDTPDAHATAATTAPIPEERMHTDAGTTSKSACCAPDETTVCCAPEEKPSCCGPEATTRGRCGCT